MLTPSPSPSLLLELRQLLETDYAVPDLWDPDKQVLLDNDAYLNAQVELIKAGTALAPGSITDVHIGTREIRDTHTAPSGSVYNDTLTNHLRTLATRIKAVMGTAAWSSALPTTLTAAKAHADLTTAHGAAVGSVPNTMVVRDEGARARFGPPVHIQDAARLEDLQSINSTISSHTHDDRYYTKTQLAASGAYGTNAIHADRLSVGTLQDARIPNLAASKIVSGVLAAARIPPITYAMHAYATEPGGPMSSVGTYTIASPASITNPGSTVDGASLQSIGWDSAGGILRGSMYLSNTGWMLVSRQLPANGIGLFLRVS